jgi:Protein of unknown function (DUF1592)/Protein of unknown function (DUF1588)/Protein of unknown function (DUF1595)/Protein of unknown function (DUF1587)/Protein of unknown function (DUF1585)
MKRRQLIVLVAAVILLLGGYYLFRSDEPDPAGGPPMVRRLTEAQYRASIADIFGADIQVAARFEKPSRVEGLVAIGTGSAGISPVAVEQYDSAAQAIAASVLSPKQRAKQVKCKPRDGKLFDQKCAQAFLGEKGRLLFRRPLTKPELARYAGLAQAAQKQLGDFYSGLELGLYTMLIAPDFLFRVERVSDDGAELDSYSKASRLSFFLTNSTPDAELLEAAEGGELESSSGVKRQVNRLMQSPRYEGAVRAFFEDMLQFDRFKDLSKDPVIYPAFNSEVAAEAQEQTLRTIVDHLITNGGDYRDLFTTRDTFLTRSLGIIYRTPVPVRGEWQAVTFAPDAKRSGIQSHVSFLALHSHPGRSSPTLRGYALRDVFLCQHVPDPPANVDFTAVEAAAHGKNVTARERLKRHATEPACAGCHKVMDPAGLTLESYDGIGTFRTIENGARINTQGSLDGINFSSSDELAKALRNHRETPRCVAERLYKSAVGRDIVWKERYYLDWLIAGFEDDDYRIPDLMRRIALSENFFAAKRPAMLARANAQ